MSPASPPGPPPGSLPGRPDTDPDDRRLVAAHLAGDHEAFGDLFTRHRDRLWAVALRTTGNPEDAADALQDAMVSAFRRADSYRGDARVTTWLHRIVVNACLDRMRRASVREARPLPDDLEDYDAPAAAAGPEAHAEQADLQRELLAALTRLPPDQRAALVLVDVEGHSVAEVAEILECPPGTVKSRCSRGRARLAELLPHLRPSAKEPESGSGTGPAATASYPRRDVR